MSGRVEWVGVQYKVWVNGVPVGTMVARARVLARRGRWVWVQQQAREPQTMDSRKLYPDPGAQAMKVQPHAAHAAGKVAE